MSEKDSILHESIVIDLHFFSCQFCCGMGYKDYPTNREPCPIPGHLKMAQENAETTRTRMEAQKKAYSCEMGNCPYCLSQGRPIGVECEHWMGLGWIKDPSKKEKTEPLRNRSENSTYI